MRKLFDRLRHFWHHSASQALSLVPFAIACACGRTVSGRRQNVFQVVRCPGCHAEVFVLPRSPLPTAAGEKENASVVGTGKIPRRWLLLVLAVGCVVMILKGTYWICSVHLGSASIKNGQAATLTLAEAEALAREHLQEAENHIRLGHFAKALAELDAVAALQQQHSAAWIDAAWLAHQRKEIGIYADLLHESLEELLATAIDLPEAEWQGQFHNRYLGKAVILDDVVTRLADSSFDQGYEFKVGGQNAKLDFDNLPFFHTFPAGKPKRVLFGARLQSIHRVQPGHWSIQFALESFTLLTNPQALAVNCPDLDDAETLKLLAEQKARLVK